MAKVFVFLAPGFEEIEALIPVDVLLRGGLDVKTVSIADTLEVESAHGITVKADMLFGQANLSDAALLVLPGGMPGAAHLDMHEGVRKAVAAQATSGKPVAAICAAPMVLGHLGLLKGRKATCYPGFEKYLDGAEYTADLCTVDGNITTGEGPAAAFPFAYALLAQLTDEETANEVATGMRYRHLMENR